MQEKGVKQADIGVNDGIFWMSINDFFTNFEQLFLCKFFDQEWTEVVFKSEWSTRLGTAGGCTNNASVGQNPQLKLNVDSNSSQPVEVFMYL